MAAEQAALARPAHRFEDGAAASSQGKSQDQLGLILMVPNRARGNFLIRSSGIPAETVMFGSRLDILVALPKSVSTREIDTGADASVDYANSSADQSIRGHDSGATPVFSILKGLSSSPTSEQQQSSRTLRKTSVMLNGLGALLANLTLHTSAKGV
ncbi:hypothetical protein VPH46_02510 [Sphingomonas sp. MJ1 (PH-R8)]|uniref:hypothetical protein n=1 Tax=Sphingomonas sp. MJ1 (PH-R8) TaxID=3112950 RepID=UPI003A895C23